MSPKWLRDVRRIRGVPVAALGGLAVLVVFGLLMSVWAITRAAPSVALDDAPAVLSTAGLGAAQSAQPPPHPSPSASVSPAPGKPSPTPSASAPSSKPATAAPTARSGARGALTGVGAADPYQWGDWLGQKVEINQFWDNPRSSAGTITWGVMDRLSSLRTNYSDGKWKGTVSIAQPMYADYETVRTCATGAEISTWAKDLQKAVPSGPVFIRLGWEFNGNWYHWSVKPGDSGAFKACWVKWFGLVKAVSSRFDLVWNPNNNTSEAGVDVRAYWPGAQYVAAAGPDGYALSFDGKLMSTNRLGPHGEPVGINAWLTWTQGKGVPFAVPEWAIREQSWSSTSPTYIDQMRAAFVAAAESSTGLAYESYFDGGTKYQCRLSIHASGCAQPANKAASDEYKKLWSKPYP